MDKNFRNMQGIFETLKENDDCHYVNDIYRIVKSNEHGKANFDQIQYLKINLIFWFNVILSSGLLVFNLLFNHHIDFTKKVAIARVPRTQYKISRVYEEIQFITDNIKNGDFCIYRVGSRFSRIKFLMLSFIKLCLNDFKRIKTLLKNKDLINFTLPVLNICARRIPHSVIYSNAIGSIMINHKLPMIYTGQMYDRFAIIEDKLSKRYNKELICIPHGIESTEEMPVGYVGDIFYCSSLNMASKLNNLYQTTKFKFNDEISRKMYSINNTSGAGSSKLEKNVVFFTQPMYLELTKQIIRNLSKGLASKNIQLYIKVHPLEEKSEYIIENVNSIDNFEEAICGNVCISISSTALVESLYNDSIPISIIKLLNNQQVLTGNYEFLNDNRIIKVNNEDDLIIRIEKLVKA